MMGGITVGTLQEARHWTEKLMEPVLVGQHFEQPTCMAEDHPQWQAALEAGRECPRVDLDPDDAVAYDLLLVEAGEHTRGMFDTKFRVKAGHLSTEEQGVLLDRIQAGLTCEAVLDKLNPKPEKSDG